MGNNMFCCAPVLPHIKAVYPSYHMCVGVEGHMWDERHVTRGCTALTTNRYVMRVWVWVWFGHN